MIDIDTIKKHEKKDVIIRELKEIFTEKKKCQNSSNDPEILACQSQIATCLRRIHVKGPNSIKIRKSTVRYVYGDPIVDMLIDSFGYQLEIEETVGSKDESHPVAAKLTIVAGGYTRRKSRLLCF